MLHAAIDDCRGPDLVVPDIDRILARAEAQARECRARDPRSCLTRPGGVLGGAMVTLTFADRRLKRQRIPA